MDSIVLDRVGVKVSPTRMLWALKSDVWLTRRDIAEKMGVKVTPSFIAVLESHVSWKRVTRASQMLPNGVSRFMYALTAAASSPVASDE